MVPIHHIFGSEELSVLSPGVAELAPEPYVGLNPEDAGELKLREGDEVVLPLGGTARQLPVKVMATLPRGIAGLPAGLPGLAGVALPAWAPLSAMKKDTTES
jgi:NADH-quinone oxidoreductase subunit G